MEKLNSTQRAYLRGMANTMNAIFQLGKEGISDNFINQINEALDKRELIKISLLETCELKAKEAAAKICELAPCESVQIIGRKIVFYREAPEKENRKIILPKK